VRRDDLIKPPAAQTHDVAVDMPFGQGGAGQKCHQAQRDRKCPDLNIPPKLSALAVPDGVVKIEINRPPNHDNNSTKLKKTILIINNILGLWSKTSRIKSGHKNAGAMENRFAQRKARGEMAAQRQKQGAYNKIHQAHQPDKLCRLGDIWKDFFIPAFPHIHPKGAGASFNQKRKRDDDDPLTAQKHHQMPPKICAVRKMIQVLNQDKPGRGKG